MSEAAPKTEKVRAIDVKPYEWGIWCTVGDGKGGKSEPFVNAIESRKWSDDGKRIWFLLGTHNFQDATPDEEMDLVPMSRPKFAPENDQAAFVAKRPTPTRTCPSCAGCGRVPDGTHDDLVTPRRKDGRE
jgi:hypothetical protein